jgi:hypothetical protein
MDNYDIQGFILNVLFSGGLGMLLSGWVAAKFTKFTGSLMLTQTLVISIILAALASFFGVIPVPIGEFWTWFKYGIGNGTLAALIYKSGVFNSWLESLGAMTTHQIEQKNP